MASAATRTTKSSACKSCQRRHHPASCPTPVRARRHTVHACTPAVVWDTGFFWQAAINGPVKQHPNSHAHASKTHTLLPLFPACLHAPTHTPHTPQSRWCWSRTWWTAASQVTGWPWWASSGPWHQQTVAPPAAPTGVCLCLTQGAVGLQGAWRGVMQAAAARALCCLVNCRGCFSTARAHTECAACVCPACRSVVVGVSIERLTHDRYKWRGEDIANISTVAQR